MLAILFSILTSENVILVVIEGLHHFECVVLYVQNHCGCALLAGMMTMLVSSFRTGYPNNGIAVHAHESHHGIDWDSATVNRRVTGYWQR